MPRSLPDGLYEHLVTDELEAALADVDALRSRTFQELSDVDAPAAVGRHLGREVERVLATLPPRLLASSFSPPKVGRTAF